MSLIKCGECGASIKSNSSACSECGCPVNSIINCVECGEKFSDAAIACPNCGCPKELSGEWQNDNFVAEEIEEKERREEKRIEEERREEKRIEEERREEERREEERRKAADLLRAKEREASFKNDSISKRTSNNYQKKGINFCSNCGAEIKIATKFCTKCGFELDSYTRGISDKGRQSRNNIKSIKFLDNPIINLSITFVFLAAVFTNVNLILPIILILFFYIAIRKFSG